MFFLLNVLATSVLFFKRFKDFTEVGAYFSRHIDALYLQLK